MTTLLLFILLAILFPHWGMPPTMNRIFAIVLAVLAVVLFVVWPGAEIRPCWISCSRPSG